LQKAKEVLAASAYPNGFKSKIMYSNTSNTELICTALQTMLAKIGIDLTLQPGTSAANTQITMDGWQNGCLAWNVGIYPELEAGTLFFKQFLQGFGDIFKCG